MSIKPPTIRITISDGHLEDVDYLPDGWDYEVHDYDAADIGDPCGIADCNEHAEVAQEDVPINKYK